MKGRTVVFCCYPLLKEHATVGELETTWTVFAEAEKKFKEMVQ